MAKTNRKCIFCEGALTDTKRAKEHVWPLWLLRDLQMEEHFVEGTHFYLPPDQPPISQRVQSYSSFVFGKVCAQCNNGWMSDLENLARPIVRRLIWPQEKIISLSSDECELLARWAFKTAIVINSASNYRQIIPSDHIQELNSDHSLPRNLKIDLVLSEPVNDLAWIQGQSGFVSVSRTTIMRRLMKQISSLYVITLLVGGPIIRMSWLPRTKFKIDKSDEVESIRIYPSPGSAQTINAKIYSTELAEFHNVVFDDTKAKSRRRRRKRRRD